MIANTACIRWDIAQAIAATGYKNNKLRKKYSKNNYSQPAYSWE